MLWTVCCLAFFGLLWAGKLTVSGDEALDPTTHLTREDLAVDVAEDPTVFKGKAQGFENGPI